MFEFKQLKMDAVEMSPTLVYLLCVLKGHHDHFKRGSLFNRTSYSKINAHSHLQHPNTITHIVTPKITLNIRNVELY